MTQVYNAIRLTPYLDKIFARNRDGTRITRTRVGQLVGVCVAVLVVAGLALKASVVAAGHDARSGSGAQREGLQSLPVAARGPIAAALGLADPAYRIHGLQASNRAERLEMSFGRAGVAVVSGGRRIGLRLDAVGRPGSLSGVGPVAPAVRANRVSYARPGVREWYANGPLGIEQGFDVARRPVGSGPLILAIGVSGVSPARVSGGSVSLSVRGVNLRYGGLIARDAHGRIVRSWLGVAGGRLMIHVDDRGAWYPLRVDPLIQQGAKLTANGESGLGNFGWTSALSSDGNTALIGGPYDNTGVGAAYVFTRSNGAWTQQGPKLVADCTSGCSGPKGTGEVGNAQFGVSVALSSDGNTALIGGDGDNFNGGAAWVFTRSGSTWSQQGAKLTPNDGTGFDTFGSDVALSSDGNTALIGGADSGGQAGAAWAFTRSGSTWGQQGSKLTPSDETGKGAVGTVALSSDGNTALIGGSNDNSNAGAAWVFTRAGSSWSQQGSKLTPNDETGAGRFGYAVALSADGNTALIGGIGDNSSRGAAWVFARVGINWMQQGSKLTPTDEIGAGEFGIGVALSSTGTTALIGADQDNGGAGAAWVFANSGSAWSQQGAKLTPTGQNGNPTFGDSVALSSDGNIALLGGDLDAGNVGAGWMFATPRKLTVSRAGTGSGAVTSSPTGIACGSACSASFAHGTPVTLAATAAAGSKFAGWSGACTGTGPCTVTMTADETVTATFTPTPPPPVTHTLAVSLQGSGSGTVTGPGISCPGSCHASYPSGTIATLNANAAPGSSFTGWGGACTGTGACTATITTDKAVTATFRILAPRISRASLTHARFRVAAAATALAAGSSLPRPPAPRGTRIRFTLSTAAKVTIAITRTVPGLRSRFGCVAPSAKLLRAHARRCRRRLTVGTLTRAHEPQGPDAVSFTGRLGRRALNPGAYAAILTATNAGGRSRPVTLAFVVAR